MNAVCIQPWQRELFVAKAQTDDGRRDGRRELGLSTSTARSERALRHTMRWQCDERGRFGDENWTMS